MRLLGKYRDNKGRTSGSVSFTTIFEEWEPAVVDHRMDHA
jgi:hypothetical protein